MRLDGPLKICKLKSLENLCIKTCDFEKSQVNKVKATKQRIGAPNARTLMYCIHQGCVLYRMYLAYEYNLWQIRSKSAL